MSGWPVRPSSNGLLALCYGLVDEDDRHAASADGPEEPGLASRSAE